MIKLSPMRAGSEIDKNFLLVKVSMPVYCMLCVDCTLFSSPLFIYVWINCSVLALELREDRAQYEAKARELTQKFASLDRCELKRVSICKRSFVLYICTMVSLGDYLSVQMVRNPWPPKFNCS